MHVPILWSTPYNLKNTRNTKGGDAPAAGEDAWTGPTKLYILKNKTLLNKKKKNSEETLANLRQKI